VGKILFKNENTLEMKDNLVYNINGEVCIRTCVYLTNLRFSKKRALLMLGEACTHEMYMDA
jgi:hypothetical protein